MRTFTQKMALWLMTLLCCAAMPQAVMAQDCLVIGEGTAHSSWYLPVANYYHNCYSQQLFLADELEIGAAQITSIAFQYDNYTSSMTRTISVYMANTDAADLSTAFVTEGLEEVLAPTVFTFDPNDEWSTIELETPFDYDGASNLVVAVYMNYSSAETSYAGGYRFAQEAKTGMSRYVSNDTSSPDQIALVDNAPTAAGTKVDYRCNMQLCYSQSGGGPTCDRPSGIAASDITAHEATLAWADGNGVYNVEYKKASDTIWTVLLSNTMENSIALADLEPTTAYQARVQSVCADLDTVSGWRTCNFTTLIGLPYTASLATQSDWIKASGLLEDVLAGSATLSSGGSWNFGARNGVLGANHAYVNVYGTGGRYWIISPEIPLEGNTELTFNLALTDFNNADPIEDFTAQADDKFVVLASSDNGETWAILEQWDNQGSANVYNQIATAGEEIAIDLSAYADQNVRIAFYVESTVTGNGDNDIHVGGVHVEHLPACTRVSDFEVSNITKTSAEFSWTANAGEAAWRFEYKKAADAEWISADITENPYLLEGLDVYTAYEARIAAICDASAEDGISAFRKPISFKTVAGIPFLETFNGTMPNEWKRYTCWLDSLMEAPDNYALQSVSAGWQVGAANGAFAASDNHLFLNIDGATCHYWLVSPTVELEDNVQLTFDLALTKSQGQLQPIEPGQQDDDKFYVLYTLDGENWDVLKYWDNGTSDEAFDNISSLADGQSVAIDLSEFAGQSIAIAFYGESSVDNGDNNLHIDNVRIDLIPDCSRPTGLIVENVTDNSAAFAWDEPEDGIAAWEYALIANPAADTVPAEEAFANSIEELTLTLSGLQENTPYAFFLRHVCGDAHSEYVVRNFKTMQTPAELPFADGFEEGLNWVISNGEYTNKWILGEAAHYGEGTHALYISNNDSAYAYSITSGAQMVVATKTFNFPEEGVYSVSFDWNCNGEGNYDILCVALLPVGAQVEAGATSSSQWALPEGWTALHEGAKLNGAEAWQSSFYELNIEEEGVRTIALVWRQDGSMGTNPPAAVDNFRIARLSCPTPIEFAIVEESATTNSVQLEWTPKAGENNWLIQYRKAGAEEWIFVADSVKAIPYTLSGLDASSVYEVRVAAWCNPADSASVSDFSASVQFQTACAAITSFPYSENFDAINGTTSSSTRVLPICWSAINTTTYASYSGLPHVYNSSSYANSGTNSLRLYSYASSTSDYDPQDQYAILPEMEGLSSLRIKFNARAYYAPSDSYNSTFVVGVMSDPEDEATFVPVQQFTIPATTYAPYEVKLNTYAGEGKYIAFKLFAAVAGGQYINSAYIDDIVIDEIPSCLEAEGLKVYGVTATSASFSWNVEEGESYVYAVAPASAEAPAAEDYAPASDSMLISGLTENTAYVLYLRRDCGSSLSPAISAPFNTKQLPVAVPYSDDFEAGNNWLLINGELTNVWVHGEAAHNGEGTHALYISNDGGATNAYTITSSSVVFATKSFTFEQGTYAFQYDWKANGESTYDYLRVALVPDDVELVAGTLPSGVTTTALPEGCIALDGGSKLNLSTAWATFTSAELTIPAGTYKVVFLWKDDTSGGAQEPAAIDNFSISKVTCGKPTGLMASDITASSVVLKWTADADQNAWEIVYSTNASFNPAEAEPVIASANPFVLEDLDPETTYYAYVRAACGDENYSSWSSILTFATSSSCALPDGFTLDALSTNSATISWNTYGQTAFNFSYSADTAAGWIDSLNVAMPFTINGLEAGTIYAIKVQPACAAEDEWTDVLSFKTAYEAPYAENFSAASSEWTKASGLLADILSGAAQLTSTSSGWSVGTGNGVFVETDSHLKINIYGTTYKYWYISPDVKIGANNQLSFDVALTAFSGTLAAPAQTGTDDKFAVLISTDGWQTWSILRQWDNAGSAYVYNNIACAAAGEPVAISLAEYEGQTVSIAFYGESTASNADNNLHVDNFLIDVVPACPKTTGLHIAGVKDTQVSFAWDEEDAAWEYGLVQDTVAEFVPQDADFTGNVVVNELTIDQLVPQTAYLFFLRKVCGEDYSEIQYIRFATTATPATLPYNQDFESGNDWELINGICNNKWIAGSATSHGGANALYVSNNDVDNEYFVTSPSMVYAAKLFDFDQPGTYTVQYYWKAGGESTYDYLRVAIVPVSVELAAATSVPSGFGPTGLPAGWIAADGGTKLNLSEDSWVHVEVEVEVDPALYYVVFAWRNDNSTGTQAPAAVDDIHIRHIAYPTDIQSAGIESTAVKFIRNDQVYILMNGAVYNVTGQKVEVK